LRVQITTRKELDKVQGILAINVFSVFQSFIYIETFKELRNLSPVRQKETQVGARSL